MSKRKIKKFPFFVILLTFALSSLSATIVFPIIAPLFLSGSTVIIRPEIPESIRAILFGMFLMSYPLAQFLFAPLIGDYSDRAGRKKAFSITLVLEIIGYVLSGAGIQYHHLSLLFLGRFITGLGAANFSVCLATLADISYDEKSRARYFSYGSAIAGVMFVFGPFIGGRLSDPTIYPLFNFAFPLWVGAGLTLLNIILIYFFFKETLCKKEGLTVDPIKALHNVESAFKFDTIRILYGIFFFFLFAWNMLYQFLPALLVEEFNARSSLIGDLSALMGIVWFVGTLTISIFLKRINQQKNILILSLILFALTAIFIPYPDKLFFFVAITGVSVFLAGGIWPILVGAISRTTDPGSQGKALGISQSIQSLSMVLAPFFGGFFLQAHSKIPFMFSSFAALIAAGLLLKLKSSFFKM